MRPQALNGSAEMAAARNQPTWPLENRAPPQTIIIQANDNQQQLAAALRLANPAHSDEFGGGGGGRALLAAALAQHQHQEQHDKQQSFADWWTDYWSRQPFPSGYTQSSIFLLACLLTTIVFLIVVGNLLVCIAIFTEKSLKPTQNWFIASLAVSDMLLGLVVMPVSLSRELMGFWVFGPLWCDIHEALDVLLTTASINTLCLISLDRYWSITQAVSYLKKRTPRRGALMIAFVWIFSAAVSLPPLIGWKKPQSPAEPVNSSQPAQLASSSGTDYDWPAIEQLGLSEPKATEAPQQESAEYPSCRLSDDVGYVLYSALGSFYIPCAVMVFTYIKIFLAARSRARRAINKQSGRTTGSAGGQSAQAASTPKSRQAPARRPDADSLKPLDTSNAGSTSPLPSTPAIADSASLMKPGKIVVVERKKSIAAVAAAAAAAAAAAGAQTGARTQVGVDELPACTLTTSQAKQASASVLSEPDTSRDSSMITVMSSNMAELPVARFNFQPHKGDSSAQALLAAIGKPHAEHDADRLLGAPDIVVQKQAGQPDELGPNATKETCFMTIEEDSDMFEAQAGRTIMMIAGNASSRQHAKSAHQITMTMLPAGQQVSPCANPACRRQHARSASSYCDSSLTINDDELEEDELLTDDCNGYSCPLDQYCTSAGSACAHCHECQCDCDQAHAESTSSAPNTNQDDSLRCALERRPDAHSSTGDDNLSLTEYRSNDDDSSIVGHDMLDATDEPSRLDDERRHAKRRQVEPGARKKSIINFRLSRLASGSPFGGQTAGGLIALASSQQQQQQLAHLDQAQHQSAPRNLKTLRQNFFLKLNQLTAKSSAANKDQLVSSSSNNNNKTFNQMSGSHSNGKSSSGTSFEPSADCATTSNLHSAAELCQDNTAPASASDGFRAGEAGDLAGSTCGQEGLRDSNQAAPDQAKLTSGAEPGAQAACNDTALLLHDHSEDLNSKQRASAQNSSSYLTSTGSNKFQRLDDHDGKTREQQQQTQQHYQLQVQQRPRKSGQVNRSSTLMSSGGARAPAAAATAVTTTTTSRAYLASDNERHKRKLAKARERRATLILGLIMAAFICSWLPFFTFYVIRAVCIVCREYIPPRIESFIVWMGYCNSAINPIIYTIFNRDFRRAFRKILFRCL